MTQSRSHADEVRLGLATSSKLSWLNAAWNTLLSNPFAVAADLCSAILDTRPFGHPEILPEPIRYRLAHGAHTLSLAELTLLTQSKGFHDAALYLTLKMMHEHPIGGIASPQSGDGDHQQGPINIHTPVPPIAKKHDRQTRIARTQSLLAHIFSF